MDSPSRSAGEPLTPLGQVPISPVSDLLPGIRDLTAGPGKLCQALGLDLTWNGMAVSAPPQQDAPRQLILEATSTPVTWQAGPRIGISRAADWPHRFVDPQSDCLSR